MFVFCVYTCYFFILIESGKVILEDCNVCEEITNLWVPETPGCMNCVFVSVIVNVPVKIAMFVCRAVTDACVCASGWVETTLGS